MSCMFHGQSALQTLWLWPLICPTPTPSRLSTMTTSILQIGKWRPRSSPRQGRSQNLSPRALGAKSLFLSIGHYSLGMYWASTVYHVVWKCGQRSWSLACPVLGCHGDLPLAWVGRSRHLSSSSSANCKIKVKAWPAVVM